MNARDTAWLATEFLRCSPWIQAALNADLGTHALDDVWDLIVSGPVQIWPTPNAVIVTAIETFPQKRLLRGWLAGGDLTEIQQQEPRICEWAKRQGCDHFVIGGRFGWLRSLEGYRRLSTSIAKDLR